MADPNAAINTGPAVDLALSATNYTPPSAVVNNADIQAYVQAQVAAALAQAQAAQAAANAPKVLSPEEKAQAAVDNRGVGLGIDERLAEVYELLAHILKKVQG